jgi:hypothetical protein
MNDVPRTHMLAGAKLPPSSASDSKLGAAPPSRPLLIDSDPYVDLPTGITLQFVDGKVRAWLP